ncbi:hypothetical protein Tco_0065167 [Tanacetum coccineum]
MAKEQGIMYAPRWGNMTVDNMTFQINNVIGNFNYPPNVPAYKPIMKFLLNCPLNKAFTNCPSVLYQNYLREFWSTVVAYDPYPSVNETEQRPLREFLIKFLVLNGQRPLILDFNTLCSLNGLDYKNGKYATHLTPAVLHGNYSSTEQVNSIQQLLAYCLITGTYSDSFLPGILSDSNFTKDLSKVPNIELTAHMIAVNNQKDLVSPLPFSGKKKKVKSQTVTPTLPKLQGPEASESLPQKRKKPLSKKAPKKTKATSTPKPTDGSEQSYSVSSGTVPNPQDPERNIQFSSTRLPLTLDEGTRKSQPLPEGTTTDPKDSGGNDQPAFKGLPSTASNKGTAKTTSHPEGPLGDKDSEGNISLAHMEPINPTVVDPSGTGAEYQVDETQSTRLRYQTLTENKGKTSSEVDPGLQTLQFTTVLVFQAYLLSKDELAQETTHESDYDSSSPNLKKFNNILPLTERQLIKYLRKVSRVLFNRITQEQWAQHEEAYVSYADLRASVEGYYEENVDHREKTNKLVQATIDSLNKTATDRVNLLKALNGVTKTLKFVQDAVKDDPALNKKVIEATEAYTKNYSALTELLSLTTNSLAWNLGPKITVVESSQAVIRSDISSLRQDTSEIKSIMSEIYQAFKNDTQADTKEPPSHTKGEHVAMEDDKVEEEPTREVALIESLSKPPLTDLILEIHVPKRERKAIATDDQPEVETKLVPASKEVRPDPDAPILMPYEINGKNFQLIEEQIQAHMDKEEQIKKAVEEAKMFEMTKTVERLKKIPKELGIQSALPAPVPEQAPFESLGRKRKHLELEPEIKVPRLECNRSLFEGVPFVNNMVIQELEYGILFTDVFGDQAFQRWNDIHKLRVDSLVSYLVMASMIKTQENVRFSLKLRKFIIEHLDQEKLKSMRVKLEALGYKLD